MQKIMEEIKKFVEERKWEKYHTPKNIAISISIEAAELLEHFQWNEKNFEQLGNDVKEEIADIMIYCLLFLYYMNENPEKIILKKIEKNKRKYPL